jgi:hypothetical protein
MHVLLLATLLLTVSGPLRGPSTAPQDLGPDPLSTIPTALAMRFPELADQSSLAIVRSAGADASGPGALTIGGGRAFARIGTSTADVLELERVAFASGTERFERVGTVRSARLCLGGRALDLAQHTLRRVRRTGVVAFRARDEGARVTVRGVAFAEPGRARLWQIVEIEAEHGGTERLVASPPTEATPGVRILVGLHDAGGGRRLVVTTIEPEGAARGRTDLGAAEEALERTLSDWRRRLTHALRFGTDHVLLRDVVADARITLLTMRDAGSGGAWSLDEDAASAGRTPDGVLLAFLRFGHFDDARALLEGESQRATISSSPTQARQGVDLLLHHFWYWRTTRDRSSIASRWTLLRACAQALVDADSDRPFAEAVRALVALRGFAELVDDAEIETEEDAGVAWNRHAATLAERIEARFFRPDERRFAPEQDRDKTRDLGAALLPYALGWTNPSGARSDEHLRTTCADVRRRGLDALSTSTLAQLLIALCERDFDARAEVFDAVLARLVQAYGGAPLRVDTLGQAVDALLFAVSGIRHAAIPRFDATDLRLELRLPRGASFISLQDARKDGRTLEVTLRESIEWMTAEEIEEQRFLPAALRSDPQRPHPRHRFRVACLEGEAPPTENGRWRVGLDVAGTLFVRALAPGETIEGAEFARPERSAIPPLGRAAMPVRDGVDAR